MFSFSSTMAVRTFGVELEFVGISQQDARSAITASRVNIGKGHNGWKVKDDCSVRDSADYYAGGEIVSPVLSGDAGLLEVQKVCEAVTAAGGTVNSTCGLHVHWGAGDFTLNTFKALVKRYAKAQDMLSGMAGRGNVRYAYSLTSESGSLENLFSRVDAAGTVSDLSSACGGRYVHLNLDAMWAHGTIEFRHAAGSLNATQVCAWIVLTSTIVEQALNTSKQGLGMIQPKSYNRPHFMECLNSKGFAVCDAPVRRYAAKRLA